MDTSAGISLRSLASMLCVLNGGDPLAVARTNKYRANTPPPSAPPLEAPRRVAVAVPAWSNDTQRQQVADGARAAGWELLGLVNEPVVAAMASGVLREGDGTALVYDLTEDHFDVTIVAIRGVTFEVLAADGLLDAGPSKSIQDRLTKTEAPCWRALQYAGMKADDIDGSFWRARRRVKMLLSDSSPAFSVPPR